MIDLAVAAAVERAGVKWGCRAVGVPKATWYHRRRKAAETGDGGAARGQSRRPSAAGAKPPWTLSVWLRLIVLAVLCCDEFCESAPAQVFYTLLDRGIYLCSISSMYRVLRSASLIGDRRPQRSYPSESRKKPRLRASSPNQVWSWDIERHEALLNRAVVKGHGCWSVAADW